MVRFFIIILAVSLFWLDVYGSVTVSGNINQTSNTGTFTFNSDITFTVATTGSFQNIILDEWVANDGDVTFAAPNPAQSLVYSVNGGGDTTVAINQLVDNNNGVFGDMTANDGNFFLVSSVAVTAGDTFTIKSGAYTFDGNNDFNAGAIGTFTGSMFLADNTGTRISNVVVVPEPGTFTVATAGCLLGVGALMRRRRSTKSQD